MRINTNVASITAQENAANTNFKIKNSLEKLSSGLKINKAADDASGLAIADKLRTQASSIGQGIDNGNSAITLLQIADKSMAEQSNILDIVKVKLIQANTDTTSTDGRKAIANDISKLLDQLDNIGKQTNYNGRQLISSDDASAAAGTHTFQIGEKATDTISVSTLNANAKGLSLDTLKGIVDAGAITKGESSAAQTAVNKALTTLNEFRGEVGSTQNQVESAVRNLMTQATNVKAAESIIRDVDYAKESANFNKQNIISQAGTYAMSQANSLSQNVMRLLQ